MATTIVCADGIGSGIRARIARADVRQPPAGTGASSVSRFARPWLRWFVRCSKIAIPAARLRPFLLARVLNDGTATILGYDAPPAILVSRHHAAGCRRDRSP